MWNQNRLTGRRWPRRLRPAPAAVQEAVHLPSVRAGRGGNAPVEWTTRAPVLDVENLTKRFGGLVAVQDASFHVRQGAIHAIIGPNGAGKTTLFNLITGLIKPDEVRW